MMGVLFGPGSEPTSDGAGGMVVFPSVAEDHVPARHVCGGTATMTTDVCRCGHYFVVHTVGDQHGIGYKTCPLCRLETMNDGGCGAVFQPVNLFTIGPAHCTRLDGHDGPHEHRGVMT